MPTVVGLNDLSRYLFCRPLNVTICFYFILYSITKEINIYSVNIYYI